MTTTTTNDHDHDGGNMTTTTTGFDPALLELPTDDRGAPTGATALARELATRATDDHDRYYPAEESAPGTALDVFFYATMTVAAGEADNACRSHLVASTVYIGPDSLTVVLRDGARVTTIPNANVYSVTAARFGVA